MSILYNNYIGTTADEQEFSILTGLFHLSEVSCSGNETSIFQCSHSTSSSEACSDGAAAIVCQGMYSVR